MKKKIFVVILVALLAATTANAHPGQTDGLGGHYNRSTGDYHYHHGFGAHDHYDMDGDGDIDCPFNFVDKTNHSGGGGSSKSSPSATSNVTQDADKNISVGKKTENKKVDIWNTIGLIFWLSFYGFLFIGAMINEIDRRKACSAKNAKKRSRKSPSSATIAEQSRSVRKPADGAETDKARSSGTKTERG